MFVHPTGMILYGGFLTAFGMTDARVVQTAKHFLCRAVMQSEAKHPLGRDRGGRRPLYPSGMILYGGFLTAFGMTDARLMQTAKHFLSRTVMQREAKHPLGRDRGGAKCLCILQA